MKATTGEMQFMAMVINLSELEMTLNLEEVSLPLL